MMPWFVWNGQNSLADYGLWISRLPKRIRPEERHEEIEIPGRAGSVTMLEGEDIYSSYSVEMVVTARNDINIDRAINWLRGSGELILSTDINKARKARIVGEVAFERVGNCLMQATIPFLLQPFSMNRFPANDQFSISSTAVMVINPGDVASKPHIVLTSGAALASDKFVCLNFGSGQMGLNLYNLALNEVVEIDCDAHLIYQQTGSGKVLWTKKFTGEFPHINAVGATTIQITGDPSPANATATVDPNWRWL